MARVHLLVSVLLELCGGIAASLAGVSLRVVSGKTQPLSTPAKPLQNEAYTDDTAANNTRVKHAPADSEPVAGYEKLFAVAEAAKIGESVACPWCGAQFAKRTNTHRFCTEKHRYNYWNFAKPERLLARKGQGLKLVRA
jgi:hypothetical protein